MSNIPDIINVDIVNNDWDVYWNELPENIKNGSPKDTIILTTPFTTGSAEQVQLEKMMQACKLSAEEYTVLQLEKDQQVAWHKIKAALQPKYVLMLGIMPMQLGISASFRLFSPNRFDGCLIIASLSLSEMEQQADAKKQLWLEGLKPVFVDNAGN